MNAYIDIGRPLGTSDYLWDVCRLRADGTLQVPQSILNQVPSTGWSLGLNVFDSRTDTLDGRPAILEGDLQYYALLQP